VKRGRGKAVEKGKLGIYQHWSGLYSVRVILLCTGPTTAVTTATTPPTTKGVYYNYCYLCLLMSLCALITSTSLIIHRSRDFCLKRYTYTCRGFNTTVTAFAHHCHQHKANKVNNTYISKRVNKKKYIEIKK